MKTPFYIAAIAYCLFSCNRPDSVCGYTYPELKKNNKGLVFGTLKIGNEMLEYRDIGEDSIAGGYYTFYHNKQLQSYRFFSNMTEYLYGEEYDSLGRLLKVEGFPSVRNKVDYAGDSISVDFYCFGLGKKFQDVKITINGRREFYAPFSDDTLFSNMKVASFSYHNIKPGKPITTYFLVKYKNLCTNKVEQFRDTLIIPSEI